MAGEVTEMRALPLHQPWATLVATGEKTIETRAYPPKRLSMAAGDRIAIHANKSDEFVHLGRREPFRSSLMRHGYWPALTATQEVKDALRDGGEPTPRGGLIAVAEIEWALEITPGLHEVIERETPLDIPFGDYTLGRWAWKLWNVTMLDEPIPARGHQGSFKVPEDALARILEVS